MMDWIPLENEAEFEDLLGKSSSRPQVIFKHSTRCSISKMIKNRLERDAEPEGIDFHYLDLLKFRSLSNEVESYFGIKHESPQIIVVKEGKGIFDADHSAIDMEDIVSAATD